MAKFKLLFMVALLSGATIVSAQIAGGGGGIAGGGSNGIASAVEVFKTITGQGIITEYIGDIAAAAGVFQIDPSINYGMEFLGLGANTYGVWNEFSKSRSTDGTTHVVVQSGDELGLLKFNGDDGTYLLGAASIGAYVDGAPGTDDMPGRIEFSTTADGASSTTVRLLIDNAGNSTFKNGYPITEPKTVDTLTACSSGLKGARSFVTDANATTFLSTVAAGGANNVPVVCNGTNWVIG